MGHFTRLSHIAHIVYTNTCMLHSYRMDDSPDEGMSGMWTKVQF